MQSRHYTYIILRKELPEIDIAGKARHSRQDLQVLIEIHECMYEDTLMHTYGQIKPI